MIRTLDIIRAWADRHPVLAGVVVMALPFGVDATGAVLLILRGWPA